MLFTSLHFLCRHGTPLGTFERTRLCMCGKQGWLSAGCRGQMVLFSRNQTCRRYFTISSFHTITFCCSNLEFHFLNAMKACTETSNTRDPHVSICTGGAGDGSRGQSASPAGLHSLLSVPWAGGSQRPAKAHSDSGPSFVGRKSFMARYKHLGHYPGRCHSYNS